MFLRGDLISTGNRTDKLDYPWVQHTTQDIEAKYCDIHQYPSKYIHPTNKHQTPATIVPVQGPSHFSKMLMALM